MLARAAGPFLEVMLDLLALGEIDGIFADVGRHVGHALEIAARQRVSDEGQEGLGAFLDKRRPGWVDAPET